MKIISLERSPAECRLLIERRLAGRAAHALKRLEESRPWYPKLDVLPEDQARVLGAYAGRCAYCEVDHESLDVDFLVPPRRGGTHEPENLVAACAACMSARDGKHLDVFLERRIDLDRRAVYARIARACSSLRATATLDRSAT